MMRRVLVILLVVLVVPSWSSKASVPMDEAPQMDISTLTAKSHVEFVFEVIGMTLFDEWYRNAQVLEEMRNAFRVWAEATILKPGVHPWYFPPEYKLINIWLGDCATIHAGRWSERFLDVVDTGEETTPDLYEEVRQLSHFIDIFEAKYGKISLTKSANKR